MTGPANPPPGDATAPDRPIVARVRFVDQLPPGVKPLRTYRHPRPCFAVEEPVPPAELPRGKPWPEPTDTLHVVFLTPEAAAAWHEANPDWPSPPDDPEAPQPVTATRKHGAIRWRPGRAVVEGKTADRDAVLAALAEFAFFEGELRKLERAIEEKEAFARADAAKAFRIDRKDRADWPRFAATVTECARLRLDFAALEPRLTRASRALPQPARLLVRRLLVAAGAAHRLEELDGRLEVLEELYEGATDRVADHEGWRHGFVLEVIIILLLLMEVILLVVDLFMRSGE